MPIAKRIFVGRKNEIEQFTQAMRPAVPTQPSLTNPGQGVRSRLFLPFGIGGIGKSELTKKCLELAGVKGWKTLLLDWDRVDNRVVEPLGLMNRLAEALKGVAGDAAIKPYMDERKRVGGLQDKAQRYRAEHPQEWQKLLEGVKTIETADPEPYSRLGIMAIRGTLDFGPKALAALADLMHMRRALTAEEAALLTRPDIGLARKLVTCLVEVAKTQSLVIALDTCEVLSSDLEEFLRDLIICPAIEQSTGLLVIVSGRFNQNNARQVEDDKGHKRRLKGYADRLADSPPIVWTLSQFAEPEISEYLRENGLEPTENLIAYVQQTAHGVPFAVQLLVEALRALGEEKVRKEFPPNPGDVDLPNMVRLVVERFLQYCLDDEVDLRRICALAMLTSPDLEALHAIWQLPKNTMARSVLNELQANYGFIQADGKLHDEVKSFLREDLRVDNREMAKRLGTLAADYFWKEWEKETTSFETLAERLKEQRWQQVTLATANALCWHDEKKAVQFLARRALEGLEFDRAFAKGLLAQADEFRNAGNWWHNRAHRQFDNLNHAVMGNGEEAIAGLEVVQNEKTEIGLDETAQCILHLWRARILAIQEKTLDALADCRAAETDVPEDVSLRRVLAQRFADIGSALGFRNNTAIRSQSGKYAYERAVIWDPNTPLHHISLAALLGVMEDFNGCIAHCDLAIELDPSSAQAFNNRAGSYSSLGDYAQALTDCNTAIKLNPNFATAYNNRSIVYTRMRKYDLAMPDCAKAIELEPQEAIYYNSCGVIYAYVKKYDEALIAFNRAIDLDSYYISALINRGKIYIESNQHQEAILDFARAFELGSSNDSCVYLLARSYSGLGESGEACHWLRLAITMNKQYLEDCHTDSDFDAIRETDEFKALLAEFEGEG